MMTMKDKNRPDAGLKQLQANNRSGYAGVYQIRRNGKWTAQIMFRKKRYCLGTFDQIDMAIKARKEAEENYSRFDNWINSWQQQKKAYKGSLSFLEYCQSSNKDYLLEEWDSERNSAIDPAKIGYGSKRKVWWRCEKNHSYETSIRSRVTGGTGCPYCIGRRVEPGRDFAFVYPELAMQWHPSKNGVLRPDEFMPHSRKVVWWQCEKGHEWRTRIQNRTAGCGCPVCNGKILLSGYNDFATKYPEMVAEWVPEKNLPLTPEMILPTSNKRIWWSCELGHEWEAGLHDRIVNRSGCPYCKSKKILVGFNDLKTLYPKIAAQWHPTLNGELKPEDVMGGSNRKVWWKCAQGHVWQAVVYSRTLQQAGCPVCAGKVKKRMRYYRE